MNCGNRSVRRRNLALGYVAAVAFSSAAVSVSLTHEWGGRVTRTQMGIHSHGEGVCVVLFRLTPRFPHLPHLRIINTEKAALLNPASGCKIMAPAPEHTRCDPALSQITTSDKTDARPRTPPKLPVSLPELNRHPRSTPSPSRVVGGKDAHDSKRGRHAPRLYWDRRR